MKFNAFAKVFLLILIFFGLSFTSCKKCLDCNYKYTDPETNQKEVYEYDEFCGNNQDVEEFKQNAKEDAQEVDGKLTCTEENEWFF